MVTNGGSKLIIEVTDNGIGLPPTPNAGVGLSSMRERAEELGGILMMEKQEKGTSVKAHLPLSPF